MRSVAVLGAGVMGAQIAAHFANAGVPALLLDVTPEAAAQGLQRARALKPGQLYTLERTNLVDMRFAKIFRFAGRRTDVGIDLYNLFNSNVTTSYQQTYEHRTNGAAWLTPTAIAAPRLARFHVTFNF